MFFDIYGVATRYNGTRHLQNTLYFFSSIFINLNSYNTVLYSFVISTGMFKQLANNHTFEP